MSAAMLDITTRELGRIATEAVIHRDKAPDPPAVDRALRRRAPQRLLPRPGRRGLELRQEVDELTKNHYVEVDLIVPELAEGDPQSQKQPWFELVKHAGETVQVFTRGERSFVVVLPQTHDRDARVGFAEAWGVRRLSSPSCGSSRSARSNAGIVDVGWALSFTPVVALFARGRDRGAAAGARSPCSCAWSVRLGALPPRARRRDRPRGRPLRRPAHALVAARLAQLLRVLPGPGGTHGVPLDRRSWCRSSISRTVTCFRWLGLAVSVDRDRRRDARGCAAREIQARPRRARSATSGCGAGHDIPTTSSSGACGSATRWPGSRIGRGASIALAPQAIILASIFGVTGIPPTEKQALRSKGEAYREYQRRVSSSFRCRRSRAPTTRERSPKSPFYPGSTPTCRRPVVGSLS